MIKSLLNKNIKILFIIIFLCIQVCVFYRFSPTKTEAYTNYVQSTVSSGGSILSRAATFGSAVTAKSLIVVAVSAQTGLGASGVSSVTDNKGNTYSFAVKTPSTDTVGAVSTQIWYAQNVTGGSSFTVTATSGLLSAISIAIHEYRGMAVSSVLDKTNGLQVTSATPTTSNVTTVQAQELLFGAFSQTNANGITATAGTNYTLRESQPNNSTSALYTEDQLVSNIGSYNASVTFATSRPSNALIATFKVVTYDSNLSFNIRTTADGSVSTFPYACSLGVITSTGISFCQYRIKVSTNATNGYTVSYTATGGLSNGSYSFSAASGSGLTAGTEKYGINVQAGSVTGGGITSSSMNCSSNCTTSGNVFSFQSVIPQTVYSANSPNIPNSTDTTNTALITHMATTSKDTPAGYYSQTIVYSVVASF